MMEHSDRNLLFGVLAVQLDFVRQEDLIQAVDDWTCRKHDSLSEILRARNALTEDDEKLLNTLVERHLERHKHKSLASLSRWGISEELVQRLRNLKDDDIQHTLDRMACRTVSVPSPLGSTSVTDREALTAERYEILGFHAAGGLGEIYRARDRELHREVALKRIRQGQLSNAASREHFLIEAEVTGGLEHPGIVPVYSLSNDERQPFYTMRFIRGETLGEAARRFHQSLKEQSTEPRERFASVEFRQLLNRFIDVCNAIEYAHSRGVLHRDIKPANVMLGPYGETLVVDWGLACGVPETTPNAEGELPMTIPAETAVGETVPVVGTPHYMSPEQANADQNRMGPTSDIYCLGATLYSLLTGKPPVGGDSLARILEKVRRHEFPVPREIVASIPAALEAICLKAMAADPAERYPSAKALADDLERFLADESVLAYPESVAEKMSRWLRRHRSWVRAGSAALALVALVSTASAFMIDAARVQVQHERDRVADNFKLAFENNSAIVELAGELEKQAGTNLDNVTKVLKVVDANFQKLLKNPADSELETLVRQGRGELQNSLAQLTITLGQTEESRKAAETANGIFQELIKSDSKNSHFQHGLAMSLQNRGIVLGTEGDSEGALGAFQAAAKIHKTLHTRDQTNKEWAGELAFAQRMVGQTLDGRGDAQSADRDYRLALQIRQKLYKDDPEDPEIRGNYALILWRMAAVYARAGQTQQEMQVYQESLQLFEELTRQYPSYVRWQRLLADLQMDFGSTVLNQGKTDQAVKLFRSAEEIAARLLPLDPQNAEWKRILIGARISLMDVASDEGTTAGAFREKFQMSKDLVAVCRQRVKEDARDAMWKNRLALGLRLKANYLTGFAVKAPLETLEGQGGGCLMTFMQDPRHSRLEEARPAAEESVAILSQLVELDPDLQRWADGFFLCCQQLATIQRLLGDEEAAKETMLRGHRQVVEFYRRRVARDPAKAEWKQELAFQLNQLGGLYFTRGDHKQASGPFVEAVEIMRPLVAADPDNESFRKSLADFDWYVFNNTSDPSQAEEVLKACRECFENYQILYKKHPESLTHLKDFIAGCESMAMAYRQAGETDQANTVQTIARNLHIQLMNHKCQQVERNLKHHPALSNRQSLVGLKIAFQPGWLQQLRRTQTSSMQLAFFFGHERFRWLEAAEDCLDLAVGLSESPPLEDQREAYYQLQRVREILDRLQQQDPLSPAERDLAARLDQVIRGQAPPAVAQSRNENAQRPGDEVFAQTKGCVRSVAFSPDGTQLAVGGQDASLQIWDTNQGTSREFPAHTQPVQTLQFSPDGTKLASGSEDGEVRVWDAATGRVIAKLTDPKLPILSLSFSPDGKTLLAAAAHWWGQTGEAWVWDLQKEAKGQLLVQLPHPVYFARVTANGKQALVVSRSDQAQLQLTSWNLASRQKRETIELPTSILIGINLSLDARYLATSDLNGLVQIWESETGNKLAELKIDASRGAAGGVQPLFGPSFSPDGTRVAAGDLSGEGFLWDWRQNQILKEIDVQFPAVSCSAFHPDGQRVAFGTFDPLAPNLPGHVIMKRIGK